MKKIISCVCLLMVVIICIRADVEPNDPRITHRGYCYAKVGDLGELNLGERATVPGQCIQAECRQDRSILYKKCPQPDLQRGCQLVVGDILRPYPECCDTVDCTNQKYVYY